jgi:hypothetical protein
MRVVSLFRSKLFWLFILIIAAAWIVLRSSSSRSPQPTGGIVVGASHLPAKTMIGGVRVSLERVEWEGDYLKVTFRTKAARRWELAWDSSQAVIGGKKVDGQGWSSSDRGGRVGERGSFFRTNRRTGVVDVALDLESYVSRGSTKIVFGNVSPSSLPITRKAGPVSVTLKKAFYGKANDKAPYFTWDGRDQLGVAYEEVGPPDNFRGRFTLTSGGCSMDTKSPDPYWRVTDPQLSVAGRTVPRSGTIASDAPPGAFDAFENQTHIQYRVETLVELFNRRMASNMITRRAMREALRHPRTFNTKQYYDADRLPSRFTWSAQVPLPPKDRRYVHVMFKDIPLPPK